jgi:hypothetical protein
MMSRCVFFLLHYFFAPAFYIFIYIFAFVMFYGTNDTRGQVPADIIVLATSDPDGNCYLETKNLDGETNLKVCFFFLCFYFYFYFCWPVFARTLRCGVRGLLAALRLSFPSPLLCRSYSYLFSSPLSSFFRPRSHSLTPPPPRSSAKP